MMLRWWRWLQRVGGGGRSTGAQGERLAAAHLRKAGYVIVARNLRSRAGEIDIVATAPDARTIVIVEVKASAQASEHFAPELRVSAKKQRKLATLAVHLARRYKLEDRPFRFDIIAVENAHAKAPTVRHHMGAFKV